MKIKNLILSVLFITVSAICENEAFAQDIIITTAANTTNSNSNSEKVVAPVEQKVVTMEYEVPKYRWGVKGGINSAAEYNSESNTNTRAGIHLGFFMESTINNKLDIQPEIVYSMQGGSDNSGVTDKFDYINIPVMFKIYVNQPRTFSVDVGPQVGYMISAKYTYKGNTYNIYNSNKLNKVDAAFCFGASYKFNQKFHLCFRVNYSVTKIASSSENVNGVGQIGAGYIF